MTLQEAQQILREKGRGSCTFKYGSEANLIAEAQKLVSQPPQE
jgi:hypothetical protein